MGRGQESEFPSAFLDKIGEYYLNKSEVKAIFLLRTLSSDILLRISL
jgi:hypothetical protein